MFVLGVTLLWSVGLPLENNRARRAAARNKKNGDVKMAKKTHASRSDLPATEIPGIMESRSTEWEVNQVSFSTATKEQDPSPLLKGLPDNMCQAPHWGYLFKGKMVLEYKNREETINAGEAYYMEPGHRPTYVEEGSEWLEFSPKEENDKTMAVIQQNLKKQAAERPK